MPDKESVGGFFFLLQLLLLLLLLLFLKNSGIINPVNHVRIELTRPSPYVQLIVCLFLAWPSYLVFFPSLACTWYNQYIW